MPKYTIYHNPRCSKSRQTLALLEENGVAPEVKLYLNDVPTSVELKAILKKLAIPARELLRQKEPDYKALKLADPNLSEDDVIDAMIAQPKLIERPIVICGNKAVLGRPPENALTLL
ncbi:MAG TPA: arsenate reductase (glutaredoxin) [Marinagarivorans sp.]